MVAREPPEIPILHQDEHVVAVDKPSGLLVHRSAESTDRVFLLQTVARVVGRPLYPVHRIDRAASGVVLLGQSPDDARWLQGALAAARKEYLVLVRGQAPDEGASDRPLSDEKRIPREAHTRFVSVERFQRTTLLRVSITSGRRHQIRRHLAHLAHQILGDTTYGKGRLNQEFRDRFDLHRLFLHAHRIVLRHEPRGEDLEVTAPLAPELEAVLARLREE